MATPMQIVSALFVENFEMRQAPGPSTRIDMTGVMFSQAAPEPAPAHDHPAPRRADLLPAGRLGQRRVRGGVPPGLDPESDDSEQVARNVSPFTVEPGKFTYRLVRGELEFDDYGTVFAHCRIDRGPWMVVPFTLLPPVD